MCSNSTSGAGVLGVAVAVAVGVGVVRPNHPLAPLAPLTSLAAWPPDYVLEGAISEYHASAPCPYPPSVLDFLPLQDVDANTIEESWPCEVRRYWVNDLKPFVDFVRFIYAYFTLIVVAAGMLLNCFALMVWSSRAMRGTSLAVYLRALSLSDMGALIFTYFLGYTRSHHTGFNTLFLNNESICRVHKILVSMFPMTSQWLQTALTVERLLVVWRPLRARNPAYPQVAVRAARRTVAMVYITLILVALTKWHFSGFEQYSAFDYQRCEHHSHSSVGAVYVYVALSTYLPGTLIFVSNAMLFLRLRRSDSLRRSLFAGNAHEGACYSSDSAARTLLLFSLLYLLLQLPLGVVETIELYWDVSLYRPPSSVGDKREAYISWLCRKLQLKWSRSLLFWLFQLSFVLNFVVYLKSGGRFRAVAKNLAWQWLSCACVGRRAGRRRGSLPRRVPTGLPYLAYAASTTCYVPAPSATESSGIPLAATKDPATEDPTSPTSSSSSGSFSSDGSSAGLSLCWRRARQPRSRSRTHSCPQRVTQRGSSPCSPRLSPQLRPRHRARLQTWANFVRSHGFQGMSRATHRRMALSTASSSQGLSPLTDSSEVNSVFDSPDFVSLPQDPVKPYAQLLSLPLQDAGDTYASPALHRPQQDMQLHGSWTSPYRRVDHSRQDLLTSSPLQHQDSSNVLQALLTVPQGAQVSRRVMFRSEHSLVQFMSLSAPTDGPRAGVRTEGATAIVERTNRRLERYLSEPHR